MRAPTVTPSTSPVTQGKTTPTNNIYTYAEAVTPNAYTATNSSGNNTQRNPINVDQNEQLLQKIITQNVNILKLLTKILTKLVYYVYFFLYKYLVTQHGQNNTTCVVYFSM